MVKIWEVDFTRFSGSTAVAYDNIGSQDLVNPTNIVRNTALPDLTVRSGVTFSGKTGANAQFYLLQAAPPVNNAYWRTPAATRSWAIWYYQVAELNTNANWDSTGGGGYIWVSNSSDANTVDNGFYAAGSPGAIRCGFGSQILDSFSDPGPNNWHLLAATLDRNINQVKFYVDGVRVASGTGATFMPATGTGNEQCIGYRSTSRQGNFLLGQAMTFDHVLSDAEVQTMYNTFLVDSSAGNDPYQTFSGTVFGLGGLPASGASIYLIHQDTGKIEFSTSSSGDGSYQVIVPYSGSYTLVSTLTPSGGSRSFPMSAISGGVFFL